VPFASTFAVGGLIAYAASRSLEVAFLRPFAAGIALLYSLRVLLD